MGSRSECHEAGRDQVSVPRSSTSFISPPEDALGDFVNEVYHDGCDVCYISTIEDGDVVAPSDAERLALLETMEDARLTPPRPSAEWLEQRSRAEREADERAAAAYGPTVAPRGGHSSQL